MNIKKIALALGLASFGLLANSNHAQAFNLVTNGGFESNGGVGELAGGITYATGWTVGATTDSAPYPFDFIVNSSADSSGFSSVFSPPNIKVWGPANGINNGFTGSPNGGDFLGVDGAYATAPISQSISGLTVGHDYTLSFQYALAQFTDQTGAITGGWGVTFGSDTATTPTLSNPSQGFSGWQTYSQTFTATSSTQTLSFLAYGAPTGLPPFSLLDGVSLQETTPPVPWETDALPVVGSALFFLGFGRWAKQKMAQKKLI